MVTDGDHKELKQGQAYTHAFGRAVADAYTAFTAGCAAADGSGAAGSSSEGPPSDADVRASLRMTDEDDPWADAALEGVHKLLWRGE